MKKKTILFISLIVIAVICSFTALHTFAANTTTPFDISSRFLTEKHLGIGCNISYSDGKMILDVDSVSAHVETFDLEFDKLKDANALKVVFDARQKCSGVRLFFITNDNEYVEGAYSSVKDSTENPYVCYLPLETHDASDIRLVFEDLETDKIEIHSIVPYSMPLPNGDSVGQIDTCTINASSNEVLIIGRINSAESDKYIGKELHLFEQPLCDYTDTESLSQIKSTLKTTVGSGDFIFRIKCNKKEDLNSYLYKKYTVAVKDGDSYVILDSPKCITNPEALSKQTNVHTQTSGKGLQGKSLSFMQDNFINETSVTVDIGKFFSPVSSTGEKFECGGNVYYYDPAYVATTDALLLPFAQKGINVSLILTLSNTENEALNKTLIHPDSMLDAQYLAYNTTSKTSLSYLRAFCEFFARRYCIENPCVTRVVFGREISNAHTSYNMGDKNLTEFTDSYSIALLTVNHSFRSVFKNVEIYTHIDNNWDTDLPFDHYTRFDGKAFLTALNNRIKDYGNFDWGVVINPYPKNRIDYLSSSDKGIDKSSDADLITFANLEVLCNFLKNNSLTYNNAPRSLAIIEESQFDSLDEQNVTADYIYNFYKTKSLSVKAYITDRTLISDNVIKHIDTSLSKQTTDFALDLLKIQTWNELIAGFNFDKVIYTGYTGKEFTQQVQNAVGRINVSSFSNDTDGWSGYGQGEILAAEKEMSGRTNLLSVKLGQIPKNESRGITKVFSTPLDMSLIPLMHFDVNIASLPPNVDRAKLTVKITSGDDVMEYTGLIGKSVWTEILCDLSDFSGISKINSISFTVSSENGEVFDDPQIFISSIEGVSFEYDSEYLQAHFMAEKEDTLLQKLIDQYAIPILVVIICVSALILSYRLHRTKEE